MCEYNKVDFSLLSNQLTIIVCMRLFRSVWSPSDAIHYGYGYLCSKDIKSPTAKLFSFFESFNDEAMWRMRLSTPYPIVVVFNNTIICNLNDNMFDTIDSEKRSQFPSTFFSLLLLRSLFLFTVLLISFFAFRCQTWTWHDILSSVHCVAKNYKTYLMFMFSAAGEMFISGLLVCFVLFYHLFCFFSLLLSFGPKWIRVAP